MIDFYSDECRQVKYSSLTQIYYLPTEACISDSGELLPLPGDFICTSTNLADVQRYRRLLNLINRANDFGLIYYYVLHDNDDKSIHVHVCWRGVKNGKQWGDLLSTSDTYDKDCQLTKNVDRSYKHFIAYMLHRTPKSIEDGKYFYDFSRLYNNDSDIESVERYITRLSNVKSEADFRYYKKVALDAAYNCLDYLSYVDLMTDTVGSLYWTNANVKRSLDYIYTVYFGKKID